MEIDLKALSMHEYVRNNKDLSDLINSAANGLITSNGIYNKKYVGILTSHINNAPADIIMDLNFILRYFYNENVVDLRENDNVKQVENALNYSRFDKKIGLISDFRVKNMIHLKAIMEAYKYYNKYKIDQVYFAGGFTSSGTGKEAYNIAKLFYNIQLKYPKINTSYIMSSLDKFDPVCLNGTGLKRFRPVNIGQYELQLTHLNNELFNKYLEESKSKIIINGSCHPIQTIVKKSDDQDSSIGIILPDYKFKPKTKKYDELSIYSQILGVRIDNEEKVTKMVIDDVNINEKGKAKTFRREII